MVNEQIQIHKAIIIQLFSHYRNIVDKCVVYRRGDDMQEDYGYSKSQLRPGQPKIYICNTQNCHILYKIIFINRMYISIFFFSIYYYAYVHAFLILPHVL